ncbi:MAG TPA: alpha/beta hydrolase [Nocardioides sp.]|nr:alpha/beta hydrolase [Nocardioides sp.]
MASTLRPSTLLATVGLRSRALPRADTVSYEQPSGPPAARTAFGELGAALDAARLVAAFPRLAGAPRGDGHLVVDIPGWKAPELSGLPLRTYLRRLGYDARSWGFGTNTGNPRRDIERLSAQVLELVEATGRPASLVGWSLGGVIAREVARLHPEAVRQVITYGTPIGGPMHTTVARAYRRGDDGGHRESRRLDETDPIRVPLTVMFSRRDGIVAWQACIDHASPAAQHVEISSTHLGMGFDPDVWAIVADRLAAPSPPQG